MSGFGKSWGYRLWERVSCRFRLNSWANAATVVGMFVGGGTHVVVVSGGRKPKTKFCVLEGKWASWGALGEPDKTLWSKGRGRRTDSSIA
jgi:hypothetical protein